MEYDPQTGAYSLTPEQAFALTDPDGAVYAPGAFELALGTLRSERKVIDAFRNGTDAGYTRFRRVAETPFNIVYEARP